jgi:hypothetical protein
VRYPGNEAETRKRGYRIIGGLSGVTFEYYRPAPQDGQPGAWEGTWEDTTNFPARVRVALVFSGDAQPQRIARTVVLPMFHNENEKKKR